MKWKVILLRHLMRSKISECYFYQTLSILVPLKCPLKKKIILIFQATIVSIGGFKGSKNISFPIDSSMSNPEFRAGLVINGPYTEAWLVSPEGNTWNKERKQDRFQDLWSRSLYFEWWVVYAESKGAKGGQTDRQTLILWKHYWLCFGALCFQHLASVALLWSNVEHKQHCWHL